MRGPRRLAPCAEACSSAGFGRLALMRSEPVITIYTVEWNWPRGWESKGGHGGHGRSHEITVEWIWQAWQSNDGEMKGAHGRCAERRGDRTWPACQSTSPEMSTRVRSFERNEKSVSGETRASIEPIASSSGA